MVERFCVFCGAKPNKKSREHIIPQWLIELTGDPQRQAVFGPFLDERTRELTYRNFAFDQLAIFLRAKNVTSNSQVWKQKLKR